MTEIVVPDAERYSPPPYRPRATLGDFIERVGPQLKASPARAAATTLVAALLLVCLVALQPVDASGVDDQGAFTAKCGISLYLFGHPSAGVQQVCRDAYAGHAISLFVAGGALLAAVAVLVMLLSRPPSDASASPLTRWRSLVSTPGRAAAVTAAAVLFLVAFGSLLPARAEADSSRGRFVAQCGVTIFAFGNDDPAVERACDDAYGARGRTFVASGLAVLFLAGGLAASVRNEQQRMRRAALEAQPGEES